MSILKLCLVMLTSISPLLKTQNEAVLILNMGNEETLPRNFRTCFSDYRFLRVSTPTKQGLEDLHISGSAQFSELSLKAILTEIKWKGPFYMIDLRQEIHGYLNGAAISLYTERNLGNRGKSSIRIHEEEEAWLNKLRSQNTVIVGEVEEKTEGIISKIKPITFNVESVFSEEQLIKENGSSYLRLYVTDHSAPLPEQVDKFIQFVVKIPKNAWIHFHCSAGNGRTTTFMTIYDMMRNAKQVAFEDIVARQYLIGGSDLFKQFDKTYWKYPFATERQLFLKQFYLYAKENSDDFKTLWSTYSGQQNEGNG